MRTLTQIPCLLTLAAGATAQFTNGTISSGNVFLTTSATAPTTNTSASALLNTFRTTGSAGTDHLFGSGWYWRIDADSHKYTFHNGATQGSRVSTYVGDTATLTWGNVDNRGIGAELAIKVYSTGASSGVAVQRMTVTNNTASPVTLNLFSYVDYDVNATTSNTAVANPDSRHQRVTNAAVNVDVSAPFADHFEVAAFANVRSRLVDALVTTLADTGLPFGPADYTSAWQWQDRVVGPNQSFTAWTTMSVGFVPSDAVARAVPYDEALAKPGTFGPSNFAGGSQPFLGGTALLSINNGFPAAIPITVLGFGRTNLDIGVGRLLVNPVFGLSVVLLTPFDFNYDSVTPVPVPADASLAGLVANWQSFYLDPGAADGLAHTGGLEWTFGSLN